VEEDRNRKAERDGLLKSEGTAANVSGGGGGRGDRKELRVYYQI